MEFPEAPDNILEELRKERTKETCSKCPHWSKPPDKYFDKILERLAGTTKGERNQALNDAAWSIARWTAGAELDEELYRVKLLEAATENGLMDGPDDGPETVARTIESGWSAGLKNPHTVEPPTVSVNGSGVSEPYALSLGDFVGIKVQGAEPLLGTDADNWLPTGGLLLGHCQGR
jgi:hypothetical protein